MSSTDPAAVAFVVAPGEATTSVEVSKPKSKILPLTVSGSTIIGFKTFAARSP